MLELSKLLIYETHYDKLQPYFGMEILKLHYMDCDSFVLSIETQKTIIYLKNREYLIDFSNLIVKYEMFSNKNKKVVGKFKIEIPEKIWIDEFIYLRSKAHSFKCGKKNINKLKAVSNSYSKNVKFDEYKKCLDGEEYQTECDIYIFRSLNHEMYLQRV